MENYNKYTENKYIPPVDIKINKYYSKKLILKYLKIIRCYIFKIVVAIK